MRVKITDDEIEVLGQLILDNSGIVLDQSKAYLFESRLNPLLVEFNLDSYMGLYNKVKSDISGRYMTKLIDAVCTNETYFFRDTSPFKLFIQKLVPDFYETQPNGTLKTWSAASATGQEVYSLIMSLFDAGITAPKFRMRFIATDISDTAIAKASRGEYTEFELSRGIDSNKLHKYFTKTSDRNWKIKDEIRALVQFKKANLLDSAKLKRLGKFDIIFCRNVAIYFSKEDKKQMFDSIYDMLNSGGVLVIGSTETLIGITDRFEKCSFAGVTYYKKGV